MDLLLHRAEHTADQAFAQAHQDERQDELVPEVARLDLHRGDAARQYLCVWDALDGAHRDAAADVLRQRWALLADADAGKSAVRARGVRVPDAFPRALRAAPLALEEWDAAAPCTPDAAQSVARSCVAPAVGEQPEPRDEV